MVLAALYKVNIKLYVFGGFSDDIFPGVPGGLKESLVNLYVFLCLEVTQCYQLVGGVEGQLRNVCKMLERSQISR